MLGNFFDNFVGIFSPSAKYKRMQYREAIKRNYTGAETNRLNSNRKPRNLPADQELLGYGGADQMRAWARDLVRNNSYAWGVVDTIVTSVVGGGIKIMSALETVEGEDIESINEYRDKIWCEWCENCELTGRFTFDELQAIVQREMVEAGEVLVHFVTVPQKFHGIYRRIPLALEVIEADRLASDKDTYAFGKSIRTGNRIVRGVEIDEIGKVVAFWVYSDHPLSPYRTNIDNTPVRIEADNILHLYRQDRVGQNRGISWFAPAVSWLRDLGVYMDNELQASAVSSCFTTVIKTDVPLGGLNPPSYESGSDADGNQFDFIQPGMIFRLKPGESIETANPGRPNSGAEPFINLILRSIAVGTGLSYEIVARDFSQTNYSSNRASQLEDRRRFRSWQKYLVNHLCKPVWEKFCDAAALTDMPNFPNMTELLADRQLFAPAEFMTGSWEWVDPATEQSASEKSITFFQSTYADELGKQGKNWRYIFYQAKKEQDLLKKLGLVTPNQLQSAEKTEMEAAAVNDIAVAEAQPQSQAPAEVAASNEFAGLSRLQWKRNRKAIEEILSEYETGKISKARACIYLSGYGLHEASIEKLLSDCVVQNQDENPCWSGYDMIGMKDQGGQQVPNCVPEE